MMETFISYAFPVAAIAIGLLNIVLAFLLLFTNIVPERSRRIGWKSTVLLVSGAIVLSIGMSRGLLMLPGDLKVVSPDGDLRIHGMLEYTQPQFTAGLHMVKVTDGGLYLASPLRYGSTVGLYEFATRSITLKQSDLNAFNWAHEVAHHVWYTKLTGAERSAWEQRYAVEKAAYELDGSGYFLTEYSTTKVEEDYGDAFATYSTMPAQPVGGWRGDLLNAQFKRLANCTGCFWKTIQFDR